MSSNINRTSPRLAPTGNNDGASNATPGGSLRPGPGTSRFSFFVDTAHHIRYVSNEALHGMHQRIQLQSFPKLPAPVSWHRCKAISSKKQERRQTPFTNSPLFDQI